MYVHRLPVNVCDVGCDLHEKDESYHSSVNFLGRILFLFLRDFFELVEGLDGFFEKNKQSFLNVKF